MTKQILAFIFYFITFINLYRYVCNEILLLQILPPCFLALLKTKGFIKPLALRDGCKGGVKVCRVFDSIEPEAQRARR